MIDQGGNTKSFLNEPAQLAWLDAELTKSDSRWKFVFGHHPLYSHSDKHGNNKNMITKIGPLLAKYKVDVYLCGHDHTLEILKPIDGVYHVVTGGGGGPDMAYNVEWTDESYYAATLGGFTLLRVAKNEIVIEFVRLDGKTEYAHTIPKDSAAAPTPAKKTGGH